MTKPSKKWLEVGKKNRAMLSKRNKEKADTNRLPIGYRKGHIEVIGHDKSVFYRQGALEKRKVICKCHYCGETFSTLEAEIKYGGVESCPHCRQKLYDVALKSRKANVTNKTGVRGISLHPKGYQITKCYKGMRISLFSTTMETAIILREELQEEIERFANMYEQMKADGCSECSLEGFKKVSKEAILHRFQVYGH